MDTKKLLGRRLKELIKQKNISQEKLAEMVNIEPAALSNIVTGRNYPLFSTLEKIIKVLNELKIVICVSSLLLLNFKFVSHSPDCLDIVSGISELTSQFLDVCVNCSCISKIIIVPHII